MPALTCCRFTLRAHSLRAAMMPPAAGNCFLFRQAAGRACLRTCHLSSLRRVLWSAGRERALRAGCHRSSSAHVPSRLAR